MVLVVLRPRPCRTPLPLLLLHPCMSAMWGRQHLLAPTRFVRGTSMRCSCRCRLGLRLDGQQPRLPRSPALRRSEVVRCIRHGN